MRLLLAAAVTALFVVAGSALTFEVTPVPMPDTGHAGEAHLTRTQDGTVVASWLERHGDEARMVVARRTGGAWTEPVEVARGGNWFVNWADVPSVAVHPNGAMMAHWLERLGEGRYAYGVRFALSSDEGRSWSAPEWLHADRSATEHGFARIIPFEDGFLAVWLDGNGYATDRREMAVHGRMVGVDGSLGPEQTIDARTCDCCPTELVPLPEGRAAAIYRDRSSEEIRDMSMSIFDGTGWSESVPLHDDGWQINACPVNGPAADRAGDSVAAAWFTMATGSPEVWYRFLNAGTMEAVSEPARFDVGRPAGRVAVRMESPGTAVVVWMEGGDEDVAGLYARRVHRDGTMDEAVQIASTSTGRAVGYPRLERDGDGWLVVWTEPAEAADGPARLKAAHILF